jgi:hypothetical protein
MSDDPCKLNSDAAARRVRLQVLTSRCLALLLGVCALVIVPQAKAQIEKMKASTILIRCIVPIAGDPQHVIVATGTAFAVGDGRHVVTNHHVVAEGTCSAVLEDGRQIRVKIKRDIPAKDLAVLELAKDSGRIPVTFASLRFQIKQGQPVTIIGFPMGRSEDTMDTHPEVRLGAIGSYTQLSGTTDAYELANTINHGNSGGPVFNSCGEVVGIVKAKGAEGVESIGFAIQASELLPELDEAGISYKTALLPCFGDAVTRYSVYVAILLGLVAIFASTRRGRDGIRNTIGTIRRSRKPEPLLRGVSGHFAGMQIKLDGNPVTIGRDPKVCQLVFPPDTKGVSRTHCKIQFNVRSDGGGSWSLEDCGSTGGTFLDSGERLNPGQPRSLHAHDRFYLSDRDTTFEVKFKEN